MNSFETLIGKIERSKELDFGTIFNNVIELFKKVWLKGFLVVLLVVVFAAIIGGVFALIGLAPDNNFIFGGEVDVDDFFGSYVKNVLYGIPQNIMISTLTMAFVAAFYRNCKQEIEGDNVQDDYFYFFRNGYFSKLLMLGIIYTGISSLAQIMFVIPMIYAFVPLAYFVVFFAFNPDLSEMEIVKASFNLGNKKWFLTFGLMFVAGLLGMLGILGCGIGVLFTISIAYLPVFFIYQEVIGFEDNNEIEQIGVRDDLDK